MATETTAPWQHAHPLQSGVLPSGCGCGGDASESTAPTGVVFALGTIGFEYGSEARRDSFVQAGLARPDDAASLLAYLEANPWAANSITWTLNQNDTPIYQIIAGGPFADAGYVRLRQCLKDQITDGVERVSIPGYLAGERTLKSGQTVSVVVPELRGVFNWSTGALVTAHAGAGDEADATKVAEVQNFLERVYYELRNMGHSAPDRALNYAATNAFNANSVFTTALAKGMRLDAIAVEASPLCRPGSECFDVRLTFFDPSRRLEQAKEVYRFTVDVSDVVPVTVGAVRHWHEY